MAWLAVTLSHRRPHQARMLPSGPTPVPSAGASPRHPATRSCVCHVTPSTQVKLLVLGMTPILSELEGKNLSSQRQADVFYSCRSWMDISTSIDMGISVETTLTFYKFLVRVPPQAGGIHVVCTTLRPPSSEKARIKKPNNYSNKLLEVLDDVLEQYFRFRRLSLSGPTREVATLRNLPISDVQCRRHLGRDLVRMVKVCHKSDARCGRTLLPITP